MTDHIITLDSYFAKESCVFILKISVDLRWEKPPENIKEIAERAEIQAWVNYKAQEWLFDTTNKENLINMILGNDALVLNKC